MPPGSASQWLEQAVLGHTLGFAPMTETTTVFVALCAPSPAPTSTTAGTPCPGTNYARQSAPFALATTPPNVAANSGTVQFPAASDGTWGSVGYFELWNAVTGGNRLYWGPLVDPTDGVTPITRAILTGDIMSFSAGVIQVTAT